MRGGITEVQTAQNVVEQTLNTAANLSMAERGPSMMRSRSYDPAAYDEDGTTQMDQS